MMLYYRKDMFQDFDIKPEDLQTWADFEKVGARLAEKGSALWLWIHHFSKLS